MYAVVLVNLPVEGTFHYHIPADFAGKLQVGHLVGVPFGKQRAQGLILGFDQTAPVPNTKPIEDLFDFEPVLNERQLGLARWLSETYLAPLPDCAWLMLPPGLTKRGDMLVSPIENAEADLDSLSDSEKRLLNLLDKRGPLRGRQVARSMPHRNWRKAIQGLVDRGLADRAPVLNPPSVQPKQIRTVSLAIPAADVENVIWQLGQPSPDADALEALAASDDPLPAVEEICTQAGCTPAQLDTLARQGLVLVSPARTWVTRTKSRVDGSESATMLRVLEALAGEENHRLPNDQLKATPNTLNALAKRGLVTLESEPACVNLQLKPEEVPAQVLTLRGADAQAAVLRALAAGEGQAAVRTIYKETGAKLPDLKALAEEGLVTLGEAEIWRDPLAERTFVPAEAPILTNAQAAVWQVIEQELHDEGTGKPVLLHGVTGSGKTEIYLRAVMQALSQRRQAIILVPEVALTPQTLRRFAARLGGYERMAIVHSYLSAGERYDTWRRARAGLIDVVVGARSGLFTPLPDVGVIILDEAHDDSYKQSPPVSPPYYDARQTALQLGQQYSATVIFGTATPTLTLYAETEYGSSTLLELPARIVGHRRRIEEQAAEYHVDMPHYQAEDDGPGEALTANLPPVQVVDMRQELRAGNRSMFSRALTQALSQTLAQEQQAILFLNRRGEATHVMCRDCGHTVTCPRCETPLTQHNRNVPRLDCHHCGYQTTPPETCSECGSSRIRYFGVGTERVEAAFRQQWPDVTTLRWDADTARNSRAHENILNQFSSGQARVLIGTQMVAKGLDLPLVTLVGVISADVGLNLPDFRAGERVFQVLTQVAGRAGRSLLGGEVILQTYTPDHYVIQAAAQHDFHAFYQREMAYRRQLGYPPFTRMARVVFRHPEIEKASQQASDFAGLAQALITQKAMTNTYVIGPAPCFYHKLDNRHRWHVIVRGPDPSQLLRLMNLAPDWEVDVDPVSIL